MTNPPLPPNPPPRAVPDRAWMLSAGLVCLILATPLFAFAAWCLYDGLIAYPARQERWEAYEQTALDPITGQPTRAGRAAWEQRARDEGWPTDPPPQTTNTDILTQHIMAAMCAMPAAALALLGIVALILHRRLAGLNPHTPPPPGSTTDG